MKPYVSLDWTVNIFSIDSPEAERSRALRVRTLLYVGMLEKKLVAEQIIVNVGNVPTEMMLLYNASRDPKAVDKAKKIDYDNVENVIAFLPTGINNAGWTMTDQWALLTITPDSFSRFELWLRNSKQWLLDKGEATRQAVEAAVI